MRLINSDVIDFTWDVFSPGYCVLDHSFPISENAYPQMFTLNYVIFTA